jgi:hypothetical protein
VDWLVEAKVLKKYAVSTFKAEVENFCTEVAYFQRPITLPHSQGGSVRKVSNYRLDDWGSIPSMDKELFFLPACPHWL